MAAASYANAWTQLKAIHKLLNETEKFGASNSPNYADLWEAINAAADYNYAAGVSGAAARHRAIINAALDENAVANAVAAAMADMADGIGASGIETDVGGVFYRLREYMLANSKTIKSRNFTYGSATGVGTPVGTGSIVVLTEDDAGYRLENCHSQVLTFECDQDQQQVERHNEVFQVRGAARGYDDVERTGSGGIARLKALTSLDTEAYVRNPSFSSFSGTTQPSAGAEVTPAAGELTDWTITTLASSRISLGPGDAAYRHRPGETAPYTLKFTGNNKIVQTINAASRATWPKWTPFLVQVAVNPRSSSTGTFTIRFGATVQNFTVGSLNNEAWNVCRLTLDKKLYHKQFNQDSMTIELEYSSAGGGSTLYLADLICAPMSMIDGLYYAAVGGQTPWLRGDKYTFTHAQNATRAINAYWLWRAALAFRDPQGRNYGFSLPSVTDASETETDPS